MGSWYQAAGAAAANRTTGTRRDPEPAERKEGFTMAKGKKDFSTVDAGRVYSSIAESLEEPAQEVQEAQETEQAQEPAEAQPQGKYTPEEIKKFQEEGKTRGRKGVKMVRVNMAFSPAIHDYIRTMANVRGETITEFTNLVFQKSMEENAEVYKRAQEFKKSL